MQDSEFINYEAYLLSDNKEAFLKNLIVGTEPYYFFTLLHAINIHGAQLPDEALRLLNKYKKMTATDKGKSMELRHLLLKYDSISTKEQEKKEIIQTITEKYLNFMYNYSQPSYLNMINWTSTKEKLSNMLDEKVISLDNYMNRVYDSLFTFNKLSNFALNQLNIKELSTKNTDIINNFLNRANIACLDGIPELIKVYYDKQLALPLYDIGGTIYEYESSFFNKMTLDQLKKLRELVPEIIKLKEFIGELFIREFRIEKNNEISIRTKVELKDRIEVLKGMYKWAKSQPKVFESFADQIVCEILTRGLLMNEYYEDFFLEYLKSPIKIYPHICSKQELFIRNKFSYDSYWHSIHNFETNKWIPHDELVELYLTHAFKKAEGYSVFEDYFQGHYLKELYYKTKLHQGNSIQDITNIFNPSHLKELQESKEITICKYNKEYFKADDEVNLYVEIKNIPTLLVKIFEFCAENYYKKNLKQIDYSINLDGLIASEEYKYEFNEPSIIKFTKEFHFDYISKKKKGIFVIEMIGNGISSRAIIKKGRLMLIERFTIAGQLFTIIDENQQICKGGDDGGNNRTGIWIHNTFHKANNEGQILIPYVNSFTSLKGILVHEDFSELVDLKLQTLTYDFKCAYLYNHEALLMGNKVKILIQPRLYVNNTPIDLSILKDQQITVLTINDTGIPSTTVFDKIKFSHKEEVEIEFPIPAKLRSIEITSQATVITPNQKDPKILSNKHSISFNTFEGSNTFCSMYLKRHIDGYNIYVLGKNGEPKPNMVIDLTFRHAFIDENLNSTLETDNEGKVILGKLDNIQTIQAVLKESHDIEAITKIWNISEQNQLNYPSEIKICKGYNIVLPLLSNELNKYKFTFVEVINNNAYVLNDLLSKLKVDKRTLIISDLQPGTYSLIINDQKKSIPITVYDGQYWDNNLNYLVTKTQLHELRNQINNIAILDMKCIPNEDNNELCTVNIELYADQRQLTRVHAFAFSYMPNITDSLVKDLSLINQKETLKTFSLGLNKSVIMNNRKLGDEYCYVLDRKNQTRYMGNTLEKPQILLKKTYIRDTNLEKENLQSDEKFKQATTEFDQFGYEQQFQRNFCDLMLDKCPNSLPDSRMDSFLNFLANPSIVYSNLKLQDNTNKIIILNFPWKKYSTIQIIATNLTTSISQIYPLSSNLIHYKDLRLKSQLKKDSFYSIKRGSTQIIKGSKFQLVDLTSTEIQVIDSIPKFFDIQKQLRLCNGNDIENDKGYDFWDFLKNWGDSSMEDKLKKYDKYACHEVNIFLYFKDNEFFKTIIKPFIHNKLEKTFIDWFLLNDIEQLMAFLAPNKLLELNSLEKVLLICGLKDKAYDQVKYIALAMENMNKMNMTDSNMFKKLFDTVLSSKTSEDGHSFAPLNSAPPMMNQFMISNMNVANIPNSEFSLGNMVMASMPMSSMAPQACFMNVMPEQAMMDAFPRMGVVRNLPFSSQSNSMSEDLLGFGLFGAPSLGNNFAFDANYDQKPYIEQLKLIRQGFKELDKTKEYAERHYYNNKSEYSSPDLIPLNSFWVDAAKHMIENGPNSIFLTQNFIYANHNHTEMLGVLALMSLPFVAGSHSYSSYNDRGLQIISASDLIIFHKEIKEGTSNLRGDILVAQRFFDPKDRYTISEDDSSMTLEKPIDEYIPNKIYGCQVIVTNCSVANQEFQVLVEIPEGSIPVNTLDYTKSHTIRLNSFSTRTFECYFYFPNPGTFKIYPSNVSKDGKIVAIAKETIFEVKPERTLFKLETLTDILSNGSHEDILNFVKTKNIWNNEIFTFDKVYWLLGNKDFFLKFIAILRERKIYDEVVWKFGFLHYDEKTIMEYMRCSNQNNSLSRYFNYINTSLLKIDRLRLYEYNPLVNSRVHLLSTDKNNILNTEFKAQYKKFIEFLCEVPQLKTNHYLPLIYYLILQDRVDEAIKFFNKIDKESIKTNNEHKLQYDYIAAYLDFYKGYPKFSVAREICKEYIDYPILSWRNLFIEIANQLAEYDGEEEETIEEELKDLSDNASMKNNNNNLKNAKKEETLNAELQGKELIITYQNTSEFIINLYEINLEILFSRNPFLKEGSEDFAYVKPNLSHKIEVANTTSIEKATYRIPPQFEKNNLFIQVITFNKINSLTYFSTSLKVQIIDNYGQVKVFDDQNKPLTKVYVKCFIRTKSGEVNFYKDGYTDLRGRFDYATLNASEMSSIDKFAIFVMSDELGSMIKEANPPSGIGKIEGTLALKSKNVELQNRFRGSMNDQNYYSQLQQAQKKDIMLY